MVAAVAAVVMIVFFAALIYLMWRMLKVMPRVKPQQIKPASDQSVGWDDIAGVEEAKGELQEIVEFLRDPERSASSARRCPGDPAARAAGDRQDAARQGGRPRVRGAVLRAVGRRLRGDVRRPRRGADPAAVRDRAQARARDHLHRRARRRRRPPRHGHLRREGPDAQPAAGRDGRLRDQRPPGRDRRLQPAGEARPGAAAARPLRPPGVRRAAGRQGPRRDPRRAHANKPLGDVDLEAGRPADQRADRRRPGEHLQRGRDLRRAPRRPELTEPTSTRRWSA